MHLPGKEKTKSLQGGKGSSKDHTEDVAAALSQIWAPTGCSHSQEAHSLGCEQRRAAEPKIAWQEENPVLGFKLEKEFANVPVFLFVGFLTGVFQRQAHLCLLQRWNQGQQHPSWALGKRGCSVATAGKCHGLCVCPICQTVLIPEICPQDCPEIAQTFLLAILLPSGKPDNFSQPDLVSLVPQAASALWVFCVHMLPFCLE